MGESFGTLSFFSLPHRHSFSGLSPNLTLERQFAYNGDKPVFLKSYYNKAGGLTRQDPDWAIKNFYQKLVDRGYNHHMSSGQTAPNPVTLTLSDMMWDRMCASDLERSI